MTGQSFDPADQVVPLSTAFRPQQPAHASRDGWCSGTAPLLHSVVGMEPALLVRVISLVSQAGGWAHFAGLVSEVHHVPIGNEWVRYAALVLRDSGNGNAEAMVRQHPDVGRVAPRM